MKKSIITFAFALFSACVFSQTAEVKNGKAVEIVPAKEVELTQEQTLMKKQALTDKVAMIQQQLTRLQQELAEARLQLANYEEVCRQLGY